MNLQNGFFSKNAAFSYALDRQTDRQTDTLSLVVKKIKESKKDFTVKLNPYSALKKRIGVFLCHAEMFLLSI